MKFILSLFLFCFVNLVWANNSIPTKSEALSIIKELVDKRPIVNYRESNHNSTRKVSIKSVFYNKDYTWDYSNKPSNKEPYLLKTQNAKAPTAIEAFEFKQAIEREIFFEKQHMSSQMTNEKLTEIFRSAIVNNVYADKNPDYAIIEFKSDLSHKKSLGYNPLREMHYKVYYNLKSKTIVKLSYQSNTTVGLPEDQDVKLSACEGYFVFATANNKTYIAEVVFLGKLRYKIVFLNVNYSEKFRYS